MATAEEVAEAYADWQVRCNANARLARMLRGWDRTVHLVASDTGDEFTITVAASAGHAVSRVRVPAAIHAIGRHEASNTIYLVGVDHPSSLMAMDPISFATSCTCARWVFTHSVVMYRQAPG